MATVALTPSQSHKLYHRKTKHRKRSILSVSIETKGIAANSRPYLRWIVLLIVCYSNFASYGYCFYNPMALQEQMQSEYDLSNLQYNSLFSAYTFPNMILPFFSGVLADILGADIMTIICFLFVTVGQFIFVAGCSYSYFPIILAGRFVFGVGMESFSLVITPLLYEYFKNKELAFALGMFVASARIGASVNNITTFWIYNKTDSIIWAFSSGLMLLTLALFFIILLLLQRYCVKRRVILRNIRYSIKRECGGDGDVSSRYESLPAHSINYTASGIPRGGSITITNDGNYNHTHCVRGKSMDSQYVSHPILIPTDDHRDTLHSNHHHHALKGTETSTMECPEPADYDPFDDSGDDLKCKDLKEFDMVFWCLVVNCGLIYSTDLSFVNIGSSYLETHYKYSQKYSDSLMTIPFIVAAALTPIMGYISDKIGKRPYFILFANVLFFAVHYTLCLLPTNESYYALIALSTLGVADSIFCAVIWPSFALVIPEKLIGTGYGIGMVCYNTVLTLSSLLIGFLSDTGDEHGTDYYLNVELFLMALSLLTTLVTVMLIFADRRSGSRLNRPTIE